MTEPKPAWLRKASLVWLHFLAKETLPTPFDIFYAGIVLGTVLGGSLTVVVLSFAHALR